MPRKDRNRDKQGNLYPSVVRWRQAERKAYVNSRGCNGELKYEVKCPMCGDKRMYHADVKYKYCDKWHCQEAVNSESDYSLAL